MNKIAVIITAAGSSTRMGSSIKKEYLPLKNGTVLSECVRAFLHSADCSILVITHPASGKASAMEAVSKDEELFNQIQNLTQQKKLIFDFQEGGSSRQASVFEGIKKVCQLAQSKNLDEWTVLIHDGARPFVSEKVIQNTINGVKEYEAAVPGVQPVDTQKLLNQDGMIVQHLNRSLMTAVQTPQGFILGKLFEAHKKAEKDGIEYTDDTEIWGNYIGPVKAVEGDVKNIKITYPQDYKE